MKKIASLALVGIALIASAVVVIVNNAKKDESEASPVELNAKSSSQNEQKQETLTKSNSPPLNKEVDNPREKRLERGRQFASKIAETMKKKNEIKVASLIEKLVKDLNLTPEQQAELEAYFAKQIELASGILSGDRENLDPEAAILAMSNLEGKGLDAIMGEILDPAQQELWTEREEKRTHRAADSAALKDLAGLSSLIELDEDQRTALYDHFYEKNNNQSATTNALSATIGSLTEGFGIKIDPSTFNGLDFSNLGNTSDSEGGQANIAELMKQQREQRIEQQVSELEPILNPTQLQDYRESLQGQGSFLDNIIGGSTIPGAP